jgi:hypothetical protein
MSVEKTIEEMENIVNEWSQAGCELGYSSYCKRCAGHEHLCAAIEIKNFLDKINPKYKDEPVYED